MSSSDKIVITSEQLEDPEVERTLARQGSFGMGAPPERVEDARTGILFRPWFGLMLVGALGAAVAWALIEPFFIDGIEITGTVENWRGDATIPLEKGRVLGIGAISDTPVWCVEGSVEYITPGHSPGPESLTSGDKVRMVGELSTWEDGSAFFPHEIELLDSAAEVPAQVDFVSAARQSLFANMALFPLVAGFVGLFIGAWDGVISRARHRALLCGGVGLALGFCVGIVVGLFGELSYGIGNALLAEFSTPGAEPGVSAFLIQMVNRGLAWSLSGAAMGLGQGVALQSRRLLLNGLIGGMVGGLLGGLLFDPISHLIGGSGGEVSRLVGLVVIGALTGLMIGLVELMAREAWVKMLTGPLAGKEFVLYRDPTVIGSSPKADIYLFKDAEVEPKHALLRTLGEGYELEDQGSEAGVEVNGRKAQHHRLKDGDQIKIGKTVLAFSQKEA